MRYVYNYSALKQRETKIYNFAGYSSSSGVSVDLLKVVAPALLVGVGISYLFGTFILGLSYFNPLNPDFSAGYTLTTLIISLLIGLGLWYIPIGGYRCYEYLRAVLKKKKVYRATFKPSVVRFNDIKIHAIVKTLL